MVYVTWLCLRHTYTVNDGVDEGSTIQLYNQSDEAYLPQAAAEALQKLSSSISQPQQQLIISGQQFTINFTNSGQTILTPIDMHSAVVDSNTGTYQSDQCVQSSIQDDFALMLVQFLMIESHLQTYKLIN